MVTITDRLDARAVYLLCCLLGGLAALGFAFFAEGLWTAVIFRNFSCLGQDRVDNLLNDHI